MGWQKTFALARRPKGCHLVTEEVLSHIRPGLENVKVRQTMFSLSIKGLNRAIDRHALFVHVGYRHGTKAPLHGIPSNLLTRPLRQHTSAALTINENYDPGSH